MDWRERYDCSTPGARQAAALGHRGSSERSAWVHVVSHLPLRPREAGGGRVQNEPSKAEHWAWGPVATRTLEMLARNWQVEVLRSGRGRRNAEGFGGSVGGSTGAFVRYEISHESNSDP